MNPRPPRVIARIFALMSTHVQHTCTHAHIYPAHMHTCTHLMHTYSPHLCTHEHTCPAHMHSCTHISCTHAHMHTPHAHIYPAHMHSCTHMSSTHACVLGTSTEIRHTTPDMWHGAKQNTNQVLLKRRPQALRERGRFKDCPLAAVQSTQKKSSELHFLLRSVFFCQQGANEKEDADPGYKLTDTGYNLTDQWG
jgi:hypothetical protein